MEAERRSRLRAVVKELDTLVTEYVHDLCLAVQINTKPGATTLEQVMYQSGKADGAAELWAYLESLSESDSTE